MNLRNKTFGLAFAAVLLCMSAFFVHAQQPIGAYGNLPFTLNNTAADTAAMVPSQMVGLLTGTPTAGATYTTPTATALCALFPFVGASNSNSFVWDWYVKNTSGGANTITAAGGTGVTLRGTGTAAQNAVRHFKIELTTCTGTPAANLYSLETTAF
jgi:hypothetical protein